MMSLIARSPWNLDNYFLMLIQGSSDVTPQATDFEWFESWIQVWDLEDSFVNKKIAQNLLRKLGVSAVQIKDMNMNRNKYFCIKMKLSSLKPIKEYFIFNSP